MNLIEITCSENLLAQMASIPCDNHRTIAATNNNRELVLNCIPVLEANSLLIAVGTATRLAERIGKAIV